MVDQVVFFTTEVSMIGTRSVSSIVAEPAPLISTPMVEVVSSPVLVPEEVPE